MKHANTIKLSSLLVIFALFLSACGDDPASSNDEEPPEFPEFENIEADLSYFEENSQIIGQENYGNFTEAYYSALGLSSITASGVFYTSFFNSANQNEAEFNDGEWRWEYSYSFEGESVSIVLTSRDLGDNVVWEMNWSFDDGQGNAVEDYTMIEGSIAKDGSSGSWTFNSLDPETNNETPFMETTWERSGDDSFESTTEYFGDGDDVVTYTYVQDGDLFDVTYSGSNIDANVYVHWNTSLQNGYYQQGNDDNNRNCWNADFTDINCSDVGY
ncbi:MAG: hypothetical protein WD357_09835 [Gracilimonas sp.]